MYQLFVMLALLLCFSTSIAGVQIGAPVPDVTLPSLFDATRKRLTDLEGKVVYIDFWASWCGPCRQSLPELERLREKYRNDFEVFAINLDENPEDGRRFLDEYPVTYPVVSDAIGKYPSIFGLKGMPTSYVIDRAGKLRYIHEGYRQGDERKIENLIRQLIAE